MPGSDRLLSSHLERAAYCAERAGSALEAKDFTMAGIHLANLGDALRALAKERAL